MQRAAVIGGGLMGHGIAQVLALGGLDVVVHDSVPEALEAVPRRIAENLEALGIESELSVELEPDLDTAARGADWVFEAAPEDLPLKQEIFERLDIAAPPTAVLATNTSVMRVGDVALRAWGKRRILSTHWWNPPFLVPLVEVIETQWTDAKVVAWTMALHADAGKKPAHVKKDVPGFIGNRLQHALWREAIALVADGVCDAKTIDDVVKSSFGARLAVLGPIENADLAGVELTRAVHSYVFPALDRSLKPSPYLDQLIAEGRLGFKSGRGFREWPAEAQTTLRAKLTKHLRASFNASATD
jgi:3-hydroxybutyryl-CoA dehydrogenase